MIYDVLLVVHDEALLRALCATPSRGVGVVRACRPLCGVGFRSVVFVDRPTYRYIGSPLLREMYGRWVGDTIRPRLVQSCNANIFGLTHLAKEDATP